MLVLLLGTDWTVNRAEVLKRISSDVRQKKGNRILIVPELVSHEMERSLCAAAGDTACRYAEVLSFTRLASRVADSMGSAAIACMDNGGRLAAVACAARSLSSQLKAYASVETRPEFLTGLMDAIDEFKRCCITPVHLLEASKTAEGSLAQKLQELSLIMESYDALCQRGKRDPRDRMTWLLEQLEEGSFAQEHTFYIDGFPDFTRQNQAVLEHLIAHSPCVTVSLNCDYLASKTLAFEKAAQTAQQLYRFAHDCGMEVQVQTLPDGDRPFRSVRQRLYQGPLQPGAEAQRLSLYRAESAYAAVMDAAQQVRELAAQGCRYRDITMVCTDMNMYQSIVNLVFHRFHIPVYQAGTEEILNKSVIATVLTALDAALSNFDQRLTLRYLHSALSPLNPDACDRVENYAIVWGIRGSKWVQDWTMHPEGLSGQWTPESEALLRELNECRSLAMEPLEHLRLRFAQADTVCAQVEALYAFLEEIHLEERLSQMAEQMDAAGDNRSAQILNQLWEILMSALDQLYGVLGQTQWETEYFTRLLRMILSQYHVGTIPPVLDAVQMGPVSAMRCHMQKHLLILGAEEGKLPGYSGSAGVLTDQERVQLRQMGVPLTGGAMEGIQAEFSEIYGVFCGALDSIRLYTAEDQPSFVYKRLAVLAGGDQELPENIGYAAADEQEAGAYLARWENRDAAQALGVEQFRKQTAVRAGHTLGKVSPEGIRALYGSTLNLSASQIDRQAECRLSYFLKYGLRAKECKEAAMDPAEFGTYVHAVLENTARCIRDLGGFQNVSLEQTMEIAHRFSEEYAAQRFQQIQSQRMTYLFQRNLRELDMVVTELWQELKDSGFQPVGFEVNFGSEDGLPPISIGNNSMNAIVRGFVDRVDTWVNGQTCYYRVVDYKTGKKDFDYCDVFNGVGLQMLLYLFALQEDGGELLGNHPIPAGVQYFPARAPYLRADGRLDTEEAEQERDSLWKRKGLLLKDADILQQIEPGEHPKRSYSLQKDGNPTGDLADREQMRLLRDYVFDILSDMVTDISSGNVEPNPYTRGTSHNACTFCPYGAVCHEKQVAGRRNYKAMTAKRFWEEMERRMTEHGR